MNLLIRFYAKMTRNGEDGIHAERGNENIGVWDKRREDVMTIRKAERPRMPLESRANRPDRSQRSMPFGDRKCASLETGYLFLYFVDGVPQ